MVRSKPMCTTAVHDAPPLRNIRVSALESDVQVPIVRELTRRGLRFCHVPNGGFRNILTAIGLRAAGVRSGVPDILIFDRVPTRPDVRGIALEVKRARGGKVSDNQREWLEVLTGLGWECRVVYSDADVRLLLDRLGL